MVKINHIRNFDDSAAKPSLSVLVPYYHDDPTALLRALSQQVEAGAKAEILLYDDGTQDKDVNDALTYITQQSQAPITLLLAEQNSGRSHARNRLQGAARGDWVLFLDADMMPQSARFLSHYLDIINADTADVIFGGFSVADSACKDTDLHRAFSQSSDCLTAKERSVSGPQYVCSSNLCARRNILEQDPFDIEFTGWGWEDSEWAARISSKYRLIHADNPALHLGLESTETLLRRFKDSAANYDLFTQKHPDLAKTLLLFKMMNTLRRVPGQKIMRPVLSGLVRNRLRLTPMKLRLIALKLWRASWYAERCAS